MICLGSGRRGDLATPKAFASRELFSADLARMDESGMKIKFVAAECGDQHAASVRSPELLQSRITK